eukprot:1156227-Pelagomonas_calceolata.AAC.4
MNGIFSTKYTGIRYWHTELANPTCQALHHAAAACLHDGSCYCPVAMKVKVPLKQAMRPLGTACSLHASCREYTPLGQKPPRIEHPPPCMYAPLSLRHFSRLHFSKELQTIAALVYVEPGLYSAVIAAFINDEPGSHSAMPWHILLHIAEHQHALPSETCCSRRE